MLIIAALHALRVGSYLQGRWYILYYSYFSDFILPFGFYFLLCINDHSIKFLRSWHIKALLIFGACTTSEILQYFGIYFFGVTFDPVDILMFALGVATAVILDLFVLSKSLPGWNQNDSGV